MEKNTFLIFLFVICIGILFVGSGVTGLYSIDIHQVNSCETKNDCSGDKLCCGFMDGDQVFRICANDCRGVSSLSQEINHNEQTKKGFVFDITGSGVKNVKGNGDYWVYILIGVILVLLAFFYKNPKQFKNKLKKRKR
jgi:hypothetical protein